MSYLYDPELRDIVPLLPSSTIDDPAEARAGIETMMSQINASVDASGLQIEDRTIPGLDADPDFAIRLYIPDNKQPGGAGILFIHGGGFVVGSLDSEHGSAVGIAKTLGVVVVSVDYRLAPENPFPAGLNDCYAGLQWLHDHCAELDLDSNRIAVIGQSAGGGMAAALAIMAKQQNGPALCFQFLGMPELDDRLETPSMRQFDDTPMWNRPNAERSWAMYLGAKYSAGTADVPVLAAPARATKEQLEGLPPAYISAMEFDPLRDEDVQYGLRLLEAGVAVELHTFPGTFHGSALVTSAAVSQRQQRETYGVLSRALGLQAS